MYLKRLNFYFSLKFPIFLSIIEIIYQCKQKYFFSFKKTLIQNNEFHNTIHQLLDWIEKTKETVRESEPVNLSLPREVNLTS